MMMMRKRIATAIVITSIFESCHHIFRFSFADESWNCSAPFCGERKDNLVILPRYFGGEE